MTAHEMRLHIEGCRACRTDETLKRRRNEVRKAALLADKVEMRICLKAVHSRFTVLHTPSPARDLVQVAA